MKPHCEHGVGQGDWSDIECCICVNNPCDAVTREVWREHRLWDIERATQRASMPVATGDPWGERA